MTIVTIASPIQTDLKIPQSISPRISLEEFIQNPPENSEWVNAQLIEKQNMGFLHAKLQIRLGVLLTMFLEMNKLEGVVCSELLCRTLKQARKPDVAYTALCMTN